MKIDKLQQSHEDYLRQRAQDKYDGKVEGFRPLEEFRKCADYLASVIGNAVFDEEDLGDMVRVALSRREGRPASEDQVKSKVVIVG